MLHRRLVIAKGFTLVEIVVAASVFSLFFLGVFNLYDMGTNVFLRGSWKMQKQKEAERFLALLRERLEMASSPSVVSAEGNLLDDQFVHIYTLASGTEVTETADETRLLLFAVCKPNIEPTGTRGLIMPHILSMQKDKDGFFKLVLRGTTEIDFPGGINNDFLDELNQGMGKGDFTAAPEEFGLVDRSFSLGNVHTVRVYVGAASGSFNLGDISGQTFGIEVTMRRPKSEDTSVTQTIFARINDSAPIRTRPANEL